MELPRASSACHACLACFRQRPRIRGLGRLHPPWHAPRLENVAIDGTVRSRHLHDFVARCLRRDPKKRASVEDLLAHPFVGCSCDCDEFRAFIDQVGALGQ